MDYVEQRMAQEASKEHVVTENVLLTPLNVLLLGLLVYTVYVLMRPAPAPVLPKERPATVFRTYTPRTLLPYNGTDGMPIYMAVRGKVHDVGERGRAFYGPGGPYENFAGRDASRGLAFHSFDKEMLTEDLDGPLDPLNDLGPSELEALEGWEDTFRKYPVIGKLVAVGDEKKN